MIAASEHSESWPMVMHNPPHPGELLAEDALPALGLSCADLAKHLSYPEASLLAVLHSRAALDADLAVRLEQAGIGSARHWVAMQMAYDLSQARQRTQPTIQPLKP
ncbi:HigA family addiction module antitoxin [Pseudomonas aeruginosa]|uniref:HigA family addiction module antitoxin n=2 Tax=Pseudomonas TaxID=286 RepID=UPI0028855396|nr:HigA family addiction module antitoxin [Pseudomonas aeruginosa]MDT1000201.1 HigA family addiction module antitoxin [Pseudomonas aeruginosa]